MSRSRWFTWTPRMEKADEPKPTRTTNLDFVSFVSPQVDDFSIIDRSAIAKSSEPVLTKPPKVSPRHPFGIFWRFCQRGWASLRDRADFRK